MEAEPVNQELEGGLRVGELFADRFEIIAELGHGGMCNVYLAHEPILDRKLALKVLKPNLSCDPIQSERFRDEARATSTLQHSNIVSILSYGTTKDGLPYIAMEYLQGRTLERVFQDEGRITGEKFALIFLPVLSALVYAHSQNIVHRDLKPANIMLCPAADGEQVKLLDFGIAKILESKNPEESQSTIGLAGSPYYMSPEQCTGRKVDQRSDIYSLACVMYEALAGRPPFAGDTAMATMYSHLNESIPGLEEISASLKLPRPLVIAITRALSKDPAERQQTMSEFGKEVKDSLAASDHLLALLKKRKSTTILTGLVCLCTFLVLAFLFSKSGIDTAPVQNLEENLHKTSPQKKTPGVPKRGVAPPAMFAEIYRLQAKHDFAGAQSKCHEAIKMGEQYREERPEWLCEAHMQLGRVYNDMKKYDEAGNEFLLASEVFPLARSSSRLEALEQLCQSLVHAGKPKKAFQTFRLYLNKAEKSLDGDLNQHMAHAYLFFSGLLREEGELEEALATARKGLKIYFQRQDYHQNEFMVNACWDVYEISEKLGKKAEGRAALEKCRSWLKEPAAKSVSAAAYNYAEHAGRNGYPEEAAEMYQLCIKDSYRLNDDRAAELRRSCQAYLALLRKKQSTR